MDVHSDWGTPGGVRYWYADRFEEDQQDRKALGRALALGAGLAGIVGAVAVTGVLL